MTYAMNNRFANSMSEDWEGENVTGEECPCCGNVDYIYGSGIESFAHFECPCGYWWEYQDYGDPWSYRYSAHLGWENHDCKLAEPEPEE